jgi:hypothetical protein
MVWIPQDDEELQAILQLEKDSDRAAAIVASAILEGRLFYAICDRLHPSPEMPDPLFGSGRPLESFSSRIELGYRIGLYGLQARNDLNTMRRIRNAFVHHITATDFKSQRIRDLCNNLKLVELYTTESLVIPFKSPIGLVVPKLSEKLADSRSRYILSAQTLVALLSHPLAKLSAPSLPNPNF